MTMGVESVQDRRVDRVDCRRPSEVFLALWRYYALDQGHSASVEDFAKLADVWQQIRELESFATGRSFVAGAPQDDRAQEGQVPPLQEEAEAVSESDHEAEPDEEAEAEAKKAPSDDDAALAGFEPVQPKISGPWSSFKNEILDRLTIARQDKVKLADIVQASNGKLTDKKLIDMINRSRLPIAEWDVLSAALAALGYPAPDGSAPPQKGAELSV